MIKNLGKDKQSMRCTLCGSELKDNAPCSACIAGTGNKTHTYNIEYKDFKISELLEITRTRVKTITGKKGFR